MINNIIKIFVIILLFTSCSKQEKKISFYHWKSEAKFNNTIKKALETTLTKSIYLHYFDLKLLNKNDWKNDGIYPVYHLRELDTEYKKYNIIPVIYITNRVFKNKIDINGLVNRTTKLIHQISNKHFKKKLTTIQIDCDWTISTKQAYFKFLELLSNEFNLSVTIRLHQIKYSKKTGIPPVKNGTLMLYNIGDLKNQQQNSILENSIVAQYINSNTNYPLKLNIGLPIFSQTIVTNKSGKIKIIKHTERSVLENDNHFKKIKNTNFTVIKDTLYKGFYLSKGYNLKLENISENEIIKSYKTVNNSKLKINDIIFYHLDQKSLMHIDLKKIITQL